MSATIHKNTIKKKKNAFIGSIVLIFFLSLVIGVVSHAIEWKLNGYGKMILDMQSEVSNISNEIIERDPIVLSKFISFEKWADKKMTTLYRPISVQEEKMLEELYIKNESIMQKIKKFRVFLNQIWNVCFLSALLALIKFVSLFSSILLFVFVALLGVLDGLLKRYIRTIEVGRESTFVYHNITSTIKMVPLWLVLAYLLLPVSIPVTCYLMLITISMYAYSYLMTSTLKKFL